MFFLEKTFEEYEKTVEELQEEIWKQEGALKMMEALRDYWLGEYQERRERAAELFAENTRLREELLPLKAAWRNHLDESPIENDDDWEKDARRILWNDSDTEKQIAVEGYKE